MAEPKSGQRAGGADDPFTQFLGAWDQVAITLVDGLLGFAQDEDERSVIRQFGPVLTSQFSEMSGYLRERTKTLSERQRQELEQFLRLSAGIALATNASTLARTPASATLRIGISSIIDEIKKLINLLFEVFGWKKPPWWDGLMLLIDEILKFILSMGFPGLAGVLHQKEVAFLTELRHLSLLRQADQDRGAPEDSE